MGGAWFHGDGTSVSAECHLIMRMTIERANEITGGLGQVSKMPCPSWGISAYECKTGQTLRKIDNTSCSKCYACKGHYMQPTVRRAHNNRIEGLKHPEWVDAMAFLINANCYSHFRWFDSGDIQGTYHFIKIIRVCERTPEIKHWLPTQERAIVLKLKNSIPDNLCVRISSTYLNQPRPVMGFPISFISTEFDSLSEKVKCEAYGMGSERAWCGACRKCWDKNEPVIGYKLNQ